jgi:hypothetical protein
MGEMRNAYKVLTENLKGKFIFEERGINGSIILS